MGTRIRARLIRIVVLCGLLGLNACGGGGSSGDTASTAAPTTSFTVPKSTLNINAALNDAAATATFSVAVTNMPDVGIYYKLAYSIQGIASKGVSAYASGDMLQVQITFRAPSSLAMGTYSDTVFVSLCYDSTCNQMVDGSPKEVAVQYTITYPTSTISVSKSAITFANFITVPSQNLNSDYLYVAFSNMPVAPGFLRIANTNAGIDHLTLPDNNSGGWLYVYPKIPIDLGPGTYSDTITITACWDAACTIPLANSPLTVPVTYTVSNTVSGNAGYTVNMLKDFKASTFDVDANNQLLYVGTLSSSANYPNSIVSVTPSTAAINDSVGISAEPTLLDVTDDSNFIYIGFATANLVKRHALPSLILDSTIQLGADPNLGPLYAKDLQVAPGHPRTVAVLRGAGGSYANQLAIFDDNTERATYTNNIDPSNLLQWGSSWGQLFIASSQVSPSKLSELSISGSNITSVSATSSILSYDDFSYAGGLIYTGNGKVFDPASQTVLGTFDAGGKFVAVDDNLNRAYFLSSWGNELRVYDLTSRTLVRSTTLPGVSAAYQTKLMRWGSDGLAFIDNLSRLIILNGPFVTQ